MNNKICNKCNIEKDLDHFYKNKNNKSGYYPCCKICWNQIYRSERILCQCGKLIGKQYYPKHLLILYYNH